MKKVLFYRRGALGDTLLTFPVLEVLKKEGYHITAIGNTDYFKIAKYAGWIDEMYSDFYPQILNRHYDKKIIFSKADGIPPFPSKRIWIVDYYFEVLKLKKDFSSILPLKGSLNTSLKNKAVLHPGSGSPKKIPDFSLFERIENFLKLKGFEVVYLVGEADEWIKKHKKNIWECLDPLEIALALKSCRLFVGVDSGISHLACYLGINSFVFFGPSDPIVWKPLGTNYHLISLNLKCSPCFPNTCSNPQCLNPQALFEKFLQYFNL